MEKESFKNTETNVKDQKRKGITSKQYLEYLIIFNVYDIVNHLKNICDHFQA